MSVNGITGVTSRQDSLSKLEGLYEKTDQAIFNILEKLDSTYRQLNRDLNDDEKATYHKRYIWLSKYLRHYRLKEDCISNYMEDQ